MSNHMDLSEIRKTIEWMTPSDGWKVQRDATGDPANLWAEYGFSVLGALLIYGPKAAEVMEISDSLTPEESQEMEALGLPINFEFGNQNHHDGSASKKLRTNKQKKTFWCNICKIELNSEDTMNSHLNGFKHMKKALTNAMASQPLQEIVPIPNPQATRKKIPLRLQQKILESSHVIVGLSFVKEYIACSNSEMEPHYGDYN